MKSSVAFYTLGCKLNFSETSAITKQFQSADYNVVSFDQPSDFYVINTCSVTDNADKKCRNIVRKAKKQNESAKVIVIGCYAQLKPKEISEIKGVNMVLGAAEKFNLLKHIDSLNAQNCTVVAGEVDEANSFIEAFSFGDRTRSFLKVQDGCDYSCSFCTIPLARGKSRSDSVEGVVENAKKAAEQGVKEIVLTGVNIGDFGKGAVGGKKKNETFIELVEALDNLDTSVQRYRISSIEPNLLSKDIINFVATSKKFMPHFHIPLQSGCNKILRLMRRRYLRELYADRVTAIKSVMPHACIGVDVIVGFPGETHENFLETYNFLNELDISYLHVFTYSERPNTLAIEMEGVVSPKERSERSKQLRSLSVKKRRYFNEQFLKTERPALFEKEQKNGLINGFTDNYIKVSLPFDVELVNSIQIVDLQTINSQNEVEASLVNAAIDL